jgi:hypothetical protein
LDCTCEQVFLDANSNYNKIEVTTNRTTTNTSRVIDLGVGNRVRQVSYQSGVLVADANLYNPGAPAFGNYGGSFEAVRQPSTTRPVLVVTNILTAVTASNVQALMDTSNPPTTAVGHIQLASGGASEQLVMQMVFIVPPGSFYKLHVVSGTPTIDTVMEYTL